MKYMLLMYSDQAAQMTMEPAAQQNLAKSWGNFLHEATTAGVLVENNGMAPVTNASTVRVREGKTLITDGPFAETHEQLAGFTLLDCKDVDEALKWAAQCPMAQFGSVEVRPMWDYK